ncbi:hypothetical protein QZH41_018232, partial [Actinostola sp. cb2023]
MNPGTARPGSRGGDALAGVLNAQIRVADRPMTRQGLLGAKTPARGPHRQVQDKSYYMGQLRAKMTELNIEITKLRKEVDQYNQENSTYLSYEKKAETLASEIKGLQGQLADYNTLVDKLNTDTEMDDIIQDYNAVIKTSKREREQKSIDEIFTQRQEKEQQIQQLEVELDQEHRMAESLVEDMPPEQKSKYVHLKNTNKSLQSELEQKQQELDALNLKIVNLEEEVSSSPVKQEADDDDGDDGVDDGVDDDGGDDGGDDDGDDDDGGDDDNDDDIHHYRKERILRDAYREPNIGRYSAQGGGHNTHCARMLYHRKPIKKDANIILLNYLVASEAMVKEDNQEIASMDRRMGELKEKIESLNSEIQQLDMDLEEHQGTFISIHPHIYLSVS